MPVIWQTSDELKLGSTDKIDGDRRALLTGGLVGGAVAAAALMSTAAHAQAPAAPALSDKPWWPHPVGQGRRGRRLQLDDAGEGARCRQVDQGRQDLQHRAHVRERDAEVRRSVPSRCAFPGSPTGGPFGNNKLVYHDEYLATEIGQIGTQFDGLGHIGIQHGQGRRQERDALLQRCHRAGDRRCLRPREARHREAASRSSRAAHLFDVEALKGGMLDAGEEITVADVRAALQKQGMKEADIK